MLKIGLLSDTHAWWDDKYAEYFSECDEIWHAGDIGSDGLAARLAALKPFRAVHGNIDGQSLRLQYPQGPLQSRGSERHDDAYRGLSGTLQSAYQGRTV